MNVSSYSIKHTNHLQERSQTWMQEIAAYVSDDLEDKIKQSGAFQRKRGVKSSMDVLKLFLLYAVLWYLLSYACIGGLCPLYPSVSTPSTAAPSGLIPSSPSEIKSARNVYLVDASVFRQQGKQQTQQ